MSSRCRKSKSAGAAGMCRKTIHEESFRPSSGTRLRMNVEAAPADDSNPPALWFCMYRGKCRSACGRQKIRGYKKNGRRKCPVSDWYSVLSQRSGDCSSHSSKKKAIRYIIIRLKDWIGIFIDNGWAEYSWIKCIQLRTFDQFLSDYQNPSEKRLPWITNTQINTESNSKILSFFLLCWHRWLFDSDFLPPAVSACTRLWDGKNGAEGPFPLIAMLGIPAADGLGACYIIPYSYCF